MSLKSKLSDLEIKDQKLKSFLSDLTDSVEMLRNNIVISDYESKLMALDSSDNGFCRILPTRLLVDEIKFSEDLNQLPLRSSNSMFTQLTHSVAQAILTATFTPLNLNTEEFDTDTMHGLAPLPNRQISIKHEGVYLVYATCTFPADAGGTTRLLGIEVNNTTCIARMSVPPQGASAPSLCAAAIRKLYPGDFLESFVYQDSGVTLNMVITVDQHQSGTRFAAHRLS
jgi:hypothetical protein